MESQFCTESSEKTKGRGRGRCLVGPGRDATDIEHDTEEWPAGGATDRQEGP